MKVEIDDFIGVFDNAVTKEYCDSLIEFLNHMQNMGKTVTRQEHDGVDSLKKNNSMYFYMAETDPLILDRSQECIYPFVDALKKCYEMYVEKYGVIADMGRHVLNPDIKLQKTLPGEGYHVWHAEAGDIYSVRRVALCMLYLNDVNEGGETEFLYQSKRIKPVTGRIVICPTAYTHTHRGNPPLGDSTKYMINGWMEFILT